MEQVTSMASERPVVIFSKSTCPMSFTVESLFLEFGVNPTIHQLDQLPPGWGREMENALVRLGCNPTVPAVFIGGNFVGGTNEVMSLHLRRTLIPMLMRAGALWV